MWLILTNRSGAHDSREIYQQEDFSSSNRSTPWQYNVWMLDLNQSIGGSKVGRQGRPPPRGVQILSFSCSFQQIVRKIIGFWKLAPLLGKILDPLLQRESDDEIQKYRKVWMSPVCCFTLLDILYRSLKTFLNTRKEGWTISLENVFLSHIFH